MLTWGKEQAPIHLTDVCGNTTYSRDYLGRNCQLPALEIGDAIAILDVGSYSYAMSTHFLHRHRPADILENDTHRSSDNWFKNSNAIIFDVGLLPRQVVASKNVFIQASLESAQAAKQLPAANPQDLSGTELEWLEVGKFVELESFTPQKLIQLVNQGIAGSQNLDDDNSLIFVSGAGAIYASESFG